VWKGVESVDFRIGENFGKVQKTQMHIETTIKVLAPKVDYNTEEIEQLKKTVNNISKHNKKLHPEIELKILPYKNKEDPSMQLIQKSIEQNMRRD